eukprot:Plantae.Rhodophyta-Palmaria_palmata.ctg3267.p2 GENE.Plantae.Rhodophyta-Palmaria_palmata.ctg3267~~Plantae.Rhodophyta-Palmaria_palmata.ctg3267.p2  ORF type:complete len:168 (-),score=18.61 Plantae.Rhodophyta-Palmaria_palmata.ctg3267:27-530(-)
MRKIHCVKAVVGRGLKNAHWVEALHVDLNDLFAHVRRGGVKVNASVVLGLSLELIRDAPEECPYHASVVDRRSQKPTSSRISPAWVQRFFTRFKIVSRSQNGKLLCSPEKEKKIEKLVVVYVFKLCRGFRSGEPEEDVLSNMDEICFKIDMDRKKSLNYAVSEHINY